MRYVEARYKKDCRDETYRIYVSDGIKVLSGNTAKYAGGSELTVRLWDILNPVTESKSDKEIIDDIKAKLQMFGGE